ncbi:hypothetical protein RIR_jg26962.t1 [Rhizophagus irregularis DAOM 181602=DAOM 197198]|nr:hypothetical protein RIR_jg26962.t1 [Rhizophagus irregularis DAOM 181602=DAOM 197198]
MNQKSKQKRNIKPIEFHAQLDNMDMKTDDESGQDNGDDDNLFHLSPEHTRHTQRSMNEKPTIMSLRFCKYDGFSGLEITLPRLGVNTWELFHSETYLEETSTRKSRNDLSGELDILIRNLEPETKEVRRSWR